MPSADEPFVSGSSCSVPSFARGVQEHGTFLGDDDFKIFRRAPRCWQSLVRCLHRLRRTRNSIHCETTSGSTVDTRSRVDLRGLVLNFTHFPGEGGDDFRILSSYSALCLVRHWTQVYARAHGDFGSFLQILYVKTDSGPLFGVLVP